MQDATENYDYEKLVGEPLKVVLNFIFLLEHVTRLIVLAQRMSSVADEKFCVAANNFENG